jgi:hypothetical protein
LLEAQTQGDASVPVKLPDHVAEMLAKLLKADEASPR